MFVIGAEMWEEFAENLWISANLCVHCVAQLIVEII